MKSISASVIIVCATALLIAGAYHRHGDTGLFLTACGCILGVIGLIGWFLAGDGLGAPKNKRDEQ